jgi:hypothetical protein
MANGTAEGYEEQRQQPRADLSFDEAGLLVDRQWRWRRTLAEDAAPRVRSGLYRGHGLPCRG